MHALSVSYHEIIINMFLQVQLHSVAFLPIYIRYDHLVYHIVYHCNRKHQ